MKPTQLERDARYKARNEKKGLVKVTVWVPETHRERLKETAKKWREEA